MTHVGSDPFSELSNTGVRVTLLGSAGAGAYVGYRAGGLLFAPLGAIAAVALAIRTGLTSKAGQWWTNRQSRTGHWTDESHYADRNASLWTARFEGGAWSATSDSYHLPPTPGMAGGPPVSSDVVVRTSVAESGRDALGPKIDAYAAEEAARYERGKTAVVGCSCSRPKPAVARASVGRSPYSLHHANASRFKAAAELALLEDHMINDPCPDCMNKHAMTASRLMSEAATLEDGEAGDVVGAELIEDIRQALKPESDIPLANRSRDIRKKIQQKLNLSHADHAHDD